MKKLFRDLIIGIIISASTGCSAATRASMGQAIVYRTLDIEKVHVVNNCWHSTLKVTPPQGGEEIDVPWGNPVTIEVQMRFQANGDYPLITARGLGNEGSYLGSTSALIIPRHNQPTHEWVVSSLQDGERSCAPPRQTQQQSGLNIFGNQSENQ